VNGDDVAVLDTKMISDHPTDAFTSITKAVIGQKHPDSVLSPLPSDRDGVAWAKISRVGAFLDRALMEWSFSKHWWKLTPHFGFYFKSALWSSGVKGDE
jgi:hypothetical protein